MECDSNKFDIYIYLDWVVTAEIFCVIVTGTLCQSVGFAGAISMCAELWGLVQVDWLCSLRFCLALTAPCARVTMLSDKLASKSTQKWGFSFVQILHIIWNLAMELHFPCLVTAYIHHFYGEFCWRDALLLVYLIFTQSPPRHRHRKKKKKKEKTAEKWKKWRLSRVVCRLRSLVMSQSHILYGMSSKTSYCM